MEIAKIDEKKILDNLKKTLDEYSKVRRFKLSDYSQVLRHQGQTAELCLGRIIYLLPIIERWYREKRSEVIAEMTKTSMVTKEGRKMSAYEIESVIKGKSAKYREIRDITSEAKSFLCHRITFIQSLLKSSDEKRSMGA